MPDILPDEHWFKIFELAQKQRMEELKLLRYENQMTKSIISRPGKNKSQSNFVPNDFHIIQQREPTIEEMEQDQFNYNLKQAERELRLLREAAQSGNPFAQRELSNSELQLQIRIQNEIELKRVKELEETRIKTSIREFEESNKDSILEYQIQLKALSNLVQSLVDEIRASEIKLFEHYQRIQKNQEEFQNLISRYNKIEIFIGRHKPNLNTNNSLHNIVSKKEQINYWLYQCTSTENSLIFFNSEINFRDTLNQLINLQKEFIEAQVKYKAFPIYPNSNVIEMPKQISIKEKYGVETICSYSSAPIKVANEPKRVMC